MARRVTAAAFAALLALLCAAGVAAYRMDRFDHPALQALPPTIRGQAEHVVHHHSLLPPHLAQHGMGNPNLAHWSFGLSTVVTDDLVRLTANKQSREGFIWNDVPINVKSWTAHLGFRVHSTHALGGDAFAVWVAEKPSTSGGPVVATRSSGFRGLGVIFDTFDNDNQRDNPSVIVVAKTDGPAGEGELDSQNDYQSAKLAGCSFDFRNTPRGDIVHATITYDGDERTLTVKVESSRHSENCATADVDLPPGYYFGLTAHTGQVADNHDIHWFVVTSSEKIRGGSEMPGVNDIEGVDARVRAAEQGRHPEYDHEKEREEKHRWRAQP